MSIHVLKHIASVQAVAGLMRQLDRSLDSCLLLHCNQFAANVQSIINLHSKQKCFYVWQQLDASRGACGLHH